MRGWRTGAAAAPRARPSPHHALAGRGLKIAHNAELRQKFNDPKTGFPVGSLLTFAAFTSVSLDDKVANGCGDHVLFNFIRLLRHGAQRADAHAAHASEVEQHVVAKAVGHFVVQRHAGEGGEGEQRPHGKARLVVVEFLPQLRVLRDL